MAEPPTGRPSRLLNLQKSPASKKAIAATNATTSPFLRLPAEIRQRIYSHALGGHVLHVASRVINRGDTGPGPVAICSCPWNYEDSDHSIMRRQPSGLKSDFIEDFTRTFLCLHYHHQCFRHSAAQGRTALNLSLLQTCRQIYHEAVLVPFEKNVFAVTCTRPSTNRSTSLSQFMNSLVPAQLKAITHLIVQPIAMSVCTRNHLLRFKGLTELQYVLIFDPLYASDPQTFVNWQESGFKEAKLENLVELSQLRSVSIDLRTVFSRDQSMLEGDTEPVPESVKAWVASAERRMLGGRV